MSLNPYQSPSIPSEMPTRSWPVFLAKLAVLGFTSFVFFFTVSTSLGGLAHELSGYPDVNQNPWYWGMALPGGTLALAAMRWLWRTRLWPLWALLQFVICIVWITLVILFVEGA